MTDRAGVRRALPLLLAALLGGAGCRGEWSTARAKSDTIDFAQNVTMDRRPQDPVFVNFEKNWRQFISARPDLTQPVRRPAARPGMPWEPIVIADCVGSPDTKGMVPQVTLTWNDPAESAAAPADGLPRRRIDLTVHHNGFARGYFSSAVTPPFERFALPSNSPLVQETEAVVLTGPALFPKLVAFRVEPIVDRDSGRRLLRHTLVVRDLGEGLTYQIRLSIPGDNTWLEDRDSAFLTPVCPGRS